MEVRRRTLIAGGATIAAALSLALFLGGGVVDAAISPVQDSIATGPQASAAGDGAGDGTEDTADTTDTRPVFLHGNCPIIAPLFYGIESGGVPTSDLPMQFDLDAPEDVAGHFAAGKGDAAITLLRQVPSTLHGVENLRLLPYTFRGPTNLTGIYAHPSTDITEPEDLRGKTIALPNWTDGIQTLAVLEERYGISEDDIDVRWVGLTARPELLDKGEVDAAYAMRKGASEYRLIFNARTEFADMNGHPPIAWHGVLARDGSVDEAYAVMERIKQSSTYGAENPRATVEGMTGTGQLGVPAMLEPMREGAVVRMDEDLQRSLQDLFDRGYRIGLYEEHVEVSEYLVDSPA